ncbi:MAG: cytochrome ubiquinol oxidase subunit I [Bacteroidales bacterium]|nr:cytochrome ubiquinol oxidase subunit I [Bacteroidales bacterium]
MILEMNAIELSRLQFAVTAMFHWIFVPLTLGLAIIIGIMETKYYLESKKPSNESNAQFWKKTTRFWSRIFAINFAIGVATGIILEFQFGTNWSNYSWFVGDIFGAPLAIEGIFAFFMESTFFAVMYFGWDKVSKRFHLASTWLTAIGANLSAVWILIANAWMQNPVGMQFNPDTARNEMVDFWEVVFSPVAINKLLHTSTSGFMLGAVVVIGISAWYLLKKRETEFALKSMKIAAIFGLISTLVLAYSGDGSAYLVAKHQPMKLAAMEGLYKGEDRAPLVAVALLNPDKEIGNNEDPYLFNISIPGALSLLANREVDSFVPGIEDIINGGYIYEDKSGNNVTALSFDQKKARGEIAVEGLRDYKVATETGNDSLKLASLASLNENFEYFGYSFLEKAEDSVPPVALTFYAFRVMVILGGYFILFFIAVLFLTHKNRILQIKENLSKWILYILILGIPMVYICSQSGWIVAEVGRQPWTIQDLLPVQAAVSGVAPGNIYATLSIFFILFTVLLVAELRIMWNQIKKGPEQIS